MIQALTDAVNLFLLNRGCKSYLNNFTLKMKAPITQEEIDYRADLSKKVNASSSIQGLFTDIEDKPRRLRILKALLTALNYGDALNVEIDAEISALEEAAAQEATAAESDGAEGGTEAESSDAAIEDTSADLGSLDTLEAFNVGTGDPLLEDQNVFNMSLTEEDLPVPSELDAETDFSYNK